VSRDGLLCRDTLWRMAFHYVLPPNQARVRGHPAASPFHIESPPPLRRPNLLKYLAGPEIGGGNFLADTSPEEKAAELAAAGGPHYRSTSARPRRSAGPAVVHPLLSPLPALHRRIRRDVVAACEQGAVTTLSGIARDQEGDTIYVIDRVAEHLLVGEIGRTMATRDAPVLLVAEGLPGGEIVLPSGADRDAT